MNALAKFNNRERKVVLERADILNRYKIMRADGMTAPHARERLGVTAPTLSRWSRAFEEFGLAGLADKTSKRRGGKSKISKDQKNFLYKATLTQHKPKIMTIYRGEYMAFCASLGQTPVCYDTFLKEYNNIPENVKILYRNGSKAFADSNPFHIRDWNKVQPMDVVFSDHVKLNFMVYKDGKEVRPWVTWWMDGHSRKALSWVVSLKPNQDTITLSLFYAIKKYGTPDKAYLDNGKDYKSKSLQGVNAEGKRASKMEILMDETMIKGTFQLLHMEPIFATPYNAKAKPIEPAHNFIHNQARLIDYGYSGANVYDRPEYMQTGVKVQGQKKKLDTSRLFTWDQVPDVVDMMFEEYNQHVHRGLNEQFKTTGLTPEDVFDQGFNYELYETWKNMVSEPDLAMLMMRVEGRSYKVHSNGIHFHKNYYFNNRLLIDQMEGHQVIVRFDPADVNKLGEVNRIYIYDSKGTFVCGAQILGKSHPTEASKEDFARVAEHKKVRREVTRAHYKEATRLVPNVAIEDMSFSNQSEGAN